ncbi:MAG: SOS response-associated peptidase [Afipia sp.]|nr:SOS response-associated peptidase [Afipia sp.]
MCGRYVITSSPEALRKLFGYADQPNFPARYNVAPTQPVPVVIQENGERRFRLMRWGLLPSWVRDPKKFALVFNARSETVLEKPAFRNAMKRRRCLIPADGYYEWQTSASRKRPYFIHAADGEPVGFAGLSETWIGPNGEEMDTVAIVTAAAASDMSVLHHRVPVTIAPGDFDRWLDGNATDAESASTMLVAPPQGAFVWHEVSTKVNRVANDGPELIVAITADQAAIEEAASAKPKKTRASVKEAVTQKPKVPKRSGGGGQGSLF